MFTSNFVELDSQGGYCKLCLFEICSQRIFDFRRKLMEKIPVQRQQVCGDCISGYKYQGVLIDNRIYFNGHVMLQVKKVPKRVVFV